MSAEDENYVMKVAEKIRGAIQNKFPKHKVYMRRHDTGKLGYVEIAIVPEQARHSGQEVTTAYSDDYFLSIDKENIQEKARKIYEDLRLHILG